MKYDLSIKVNVPQPWRTIGRIFIISAIIIGLVAIWVTFFNKKIIEGIEDIILINTIVMISSIIFAFPFFIPFFIGRYPNWVVRLFGEKYLLKLIRDCETLLSARRVKKATLANRNSWLSDHRVTWLFFLGTVVLLGIYFGNLYA